MDKRLAIMSVVVAAAMMFLVYPNGFIAVTIVALFSTLIIVLIKRNADDDANYLIQLFILALLARLVFGLLVEVYDLRSFFGNDSTLYDRAGYRLTEIWFGTGFMPDDDFSRRVLGTGAGWGMFYFVGAIYAVLGRNVYAAQSICGLIGAATVPMVYFCAFQLFSNRRVARVTAFLVALFPAFIIWSGQLLKDGIIIFLLVLSVFLVTQLQKRISLLDIVILVLSMFAIISLRFYIFYMVALAVLGAFLVGFKNTPAAIFRRIAILAGIGLALTYFGVIRNSTSDINEFANFERIERSRQSLAASADSGYGEDLDVSTAGGALAALPIGFSYLMFAPFPWQVANFRQAITFPEVLVWWATFPFMISGLLYTIRNKLRATIPILVFSIMLTLAYSIFLGNVGTAYRQRTQIQVFLFMFVAVGWTIRAEKKENIQLVNRGHLNS